MNNCETCIDRETCSKSIGIMFGGCNISYKPDTDALYKRLDNLEGCENNPIYAAEIKQIRKEIAMQTNNM